MENNERFYADEKIIGVEKVNDFKTNLGNQVYRLVLENGKKKLVSETTYKKFTSSDKIDKTKHQEMRFNDLAKSIVDLVAEYDVANYEMESLLNNIARIINDKMNRASNYLWTGDDSQFSYGMGYATFRTMLDADEIIKSIPKDEKSEPKKESGDTTKA